MAECPKLIPVKTDPSDRVVEFLKLYSNVIADLYDLKCLQFLTEVMKALKDIRRLKYGIGERHEKVFYVDVKFENSAARCAYMYSYSVLNTSVVYSEFSKYLKAKEDIFFALFSKKTLKICCLAGGPATEAVAVSKAIIDFIGKFSSEDISSFTDFHVTVVDICPEWKSEEEKIINVLSNTPNFFNSKKVHFHADFLEADLLKPFEEALKDKIKEANIITVVKFANASIEKCERGCIYKLENMIKNVIHSMDEDSCLFMLDTAGGNVFNHLMRIISQHQSSFNLQESKHKSYRLLPKTLQMMEAALNFRRFAETSTLFPTLLTKVSSCIWIKKPPLVKKKKSKKKIKADNDNCKKDASIVKDDRK